MGPKSDEQFVSDCRLVCFASKDSFILTFAICISSCLVRVPLDEREHERSRLMNFLGDVRQNAFLLVGDY